MNPMTDIEYLRYLAAIYTQRAKITGKLSEDAGRLTAIADALEMTSAAGGVIECEHDLAEKETASSWEGCCPLCLHKARNNLAGQVRDLQDRISRASEVLRSVA